uniref:PGG domain-containing protein n=1 Tax=Ananas comosus var. bracteatus TaxID=296719 RepID=A0A6V7PT44_ANACO|nr:unnamed protein product [Ananas comosus var. bracteatus]
MAAAVAGEESGEQQRLDYKTRELAGVTKGGNSALHIAADFGHIELAELICSRDISLLEGRNATLETPLHCAARAGADRIIVFFISKARQLEAVLRATDQEGKTALHVAAEEGRVAAATELMSALPGLAAIVDDNGVSPLYAAVLSKSLEIVQILIGSRSEASYAGPNGQTALHAAAIIESQEITEKLLQWKPILTKNVDSSGSTPLHYLAATGNHYMMRQLLKQDTSPTYISDYKGLCPIHVASRMGRLSIIRELISCCPDMGELVDGRGRNFLHIAIQHKRERIVRFVCKHPLFLRVKNGTDCEGNTPLHLAVKSKNRTIVCLLLENVSVRLSIVNKDGKNTSRSCNSRAQLWLNNWIYWCLKGAGAISGSRRLDHLAGENLTQPGLKKELKEEQETYKSAPQNLLVASVLIVTVTFAAAFTMPGGYRADDHQNGGSPTLAGKYAFNVFIVADTLAFTYSVQATLTVMYAGSHVVDPSRRFVPIRDFIAMAALLMVAAFAMSVYVLLAPLSKSIAILCCAMPLAFTSIFLSLWARRPFLLAMVLTRRLGWSGMFKRCVAMRPWEIFPVGNYNCFMLSRKALYLVLYASIFLLPLADVWGRHYCNSHKHSSRCSFFYG